MSTKATAKPKRKSAPQKSKAKTVAPKKPSRSLEAVVGPEVYRTWVSMLRELVPGGRTHRLAPLVATMLQYAISVAGDTRADDGDEQSISQSLVASTETSDPAEVEALLHDAVSRLFKDAGVEYGRTNARGQAYSILEDAYAEYVAWYDMPWE